MVAEATATFNSRAEKLKHHALCFEPRTQSHFGSWRGFTCFEVHRAVTTSVYTVTDACGAFATCDQTITVHDTTPPTIICPTTVTVNADAGICTASGVNLGTPTTGDNCGVASVTNNAPAIFP